MPMPILIADGRNPGEVVISGNATVFEFNPWEFGTFDPTVFGFVPMEFLGSKFQAGRLPANEDCVRGFDNVGFVMGTSSSLFNNALMLLANAKLPDFVRSALDRILVNLGRDNNDIAVYDHNPFFQFAQRSSPFADETSLYVADGGEDGQNIPLHPLIQPARRVDVVFAVDSTADSNLSWPDGSSLIATYRRSLNSSGIGNGTAFPSIPDNNTFINLGLNSRPTFFGCDSKNITGPAPLIVYIPNLPYVTFSNVSTLDLQYSNSKRDIMIENGYDVVTMANGTRDANWSACVGCAMLSRSMERTQTPVPDICRTCFKTYCWDGTLNSTKPPVYAPSIILSELKVRGAAPRPSNPGIFAVTAAVALAVMVSSI
jgi:lysophospholipase